MDKFEAAVARAEAAQRLLDDPFLDQAFTETRQAILEAWAKLDSTESEHSKDLHRMLKALEKVRRVIETHIQTGKIAQKELEGRSKRLFSFGAR